MLNIALPKGRLGNKVYRLLEVLGYRCDELTDESSRKLIFENPECGVRYFLVKPSDVAIYVEKGAADIGVVGKDILLENSPEIYELLDLGFGKCRMCVCGPESAKAKLESQELIRVATKYPHIAKDYFYNKKH